MYFVLLVIFISAQTPSAPLITLNELSEEDCNTAKDSLQKFYRSSGYAEHVRVLCVPGTTLTVLPGLF